MFLGYKLPAEYPRGEHSPHDLLLLYANQDSPVFQNTASAELLHAEKS